MKRSVLVACGLAVAVSVYGQNTGGAAGAGGAAAGGGAPAGRPPGTLVPPPPTAGAQGGPVGGNVGGTINGTARAGVNGTTGGAVGGGAAAGSLGGATGNSVGGATGASLGGATGNSIGGATGGGVGSAGAGAVGGTRPAQETIVESNQEVLPTVPAVLPPPPLVNGQAYTPPAVQSPGGAIGGPVQQGSALPARSPQLGNNRTMLTTGPDLHNDRALTVGDHKLLEEVRAQVLPVLNVAAAESPVNFILRNGVVILTGSVVSLQQRERIVELVRQTPGVVSVVDELEVGARRAPRESIVHQSDATSTNLTTTGRERGRVDRPKPE